jgi:hypothetical protein
VPTKSDAADKQRRRAILAAHGDRCRYCGGAATARLTSSTAKTTVDRQADASDVVGSMAGKKNRCSTEFVGFTPSTSWDP